MKRIIFLFSIILLLCFASAASLTESAPLSLSDAYSIMDVFEDGEYESIWEKKALEKVNAQHTRDWEKEYGSYNRWQGNVTAAYVREYGFMPSHDTLSVNPLCILPGKDSLPVSVARNLASQAVAKVEKRLAREKLDSMFSTWEYCVSRELGWFWNPLGTWVFSWYDVADKLACRAYVDDCAAKVTIVFIYLDRTPDDEGIKIYTKF